MDGLAHRFIIVILLSFLSQPLIFGQAEGCSVIPIPADIKCKSGSFELNTTTKILCTAECQSEATYFAEWLNAAAKATFEVQVSTNTPSENFILFTTTLKRSVNEPALSANQKELENDKAIKVDYESYTLNIEKKCIVVQSPSNTGIFYGIQTLRQLLPLAAEQGTLALPAQVSNMSITDQPQFAHRGLLLDCCRHFMTKEFVLKTIDLMAQYKLNVFHWHLTEDQGWRIEIDQYPQLTTVGAWRIEEDGSRYGGYYTKQDIKDVVAYATQRQIMVIPEIEMPGHCLAAIAAYPQLSCTGEEVQVSHEWGVFKDIYCAGNDSTFLFLQNVLTEICELFPAPYIHIGGDEAPKYRWDNCSKCRKRMEENNFETTAQLQTYFIERVAAFLKTKNKSIIGWDEILEGGIPADAMIQSWRGMDGGIAAAKAHHFVVMSPTSHCYLDYGLESINLEKVYSYNPLPDALNAFEKTFIRGAECNMWTEHAPQEIAHSKIFPRLIALSEVLWSPQNKQDYSHFHQRINNHYPRLDAQTLKYGFEAVPYSIASTADENGQIIVQLKRNDEHVALNYKLQPLGRKTNNAGDIKSAKKQITIKEPSTLTVNASWHGKKYDKELVRIFNPQLALGKDLQLSYIPSPYYTGGGNNALVDGSLGTASFRDGLWQAVQGNNMEAIIDLKEITDISHINTNWYHYINAWIFRPEKVEYYISTDGNTWQLAATALPALDIKTEGELITTMNATLAPTQARYIKMVAHNSGPCPVWHDAVGEPSWLFCDEIVVE